MKKQPKLTNKFTQLAGAARRKAADRLASKVEEAQKPISVESTPRWRDNGFSGILVAAIKAAAPKSTEVGEVANGSTKAQGSGDQLDDDQVAEQEAIQRFRQKRGLLQKKIVSAEQRCHETATEAEKLRSQVANLDDGVRDIIGKRFAVEVKAGDLESRVQETQTMYSSLLQQSDLDQEAFSRATELQQLMMQNIVSASPGSRHRRTTFRADGGKRKPESRRPSVGKRRPSSSQAHARKMQRPTSSPALGRCSALSSTPPKWLPATQADAVLSEAEGITRDLQSAKALHRVSCPLLHEVAVTEAEIGSRRESLDGLEKVFSEGEHNLEKLQHSVKDVNTEIKKMQVARQIKMVNVRRWRNEITNLQDACTEQEERVGESHAAFEEEQINSAAQAVQMQRPIESNKQIQQKLKDEISQSMGVCARRELEARHINDWRLATAAQFKQQKEIQDGRARRLQAANVHLQKQVWCAQDSSLSFSTQNRTLNVRM